MYLPTGNTSLSTSTAFALSTTASHCDSPSSHHHLTQKIPAFFSLSFLRICLPLSLSSCLSAGFSGQVLADDNGSLNFMWATGSKTAYTDDPHWRSSLRLGKIGSTVPRRQRLPLVLLAVLSARSLRVPSLQKISTISCQAYDLICRTTEIHSVSGTPAKVK